MTNFLKNSGTTGFLFQQGNRVLNTPETRTLMKRRVKGLRIVSVNTNGQLKIFIPGNSIECPTFK